MKWMARSNGLVFKGEDLQPRGRGFTCKQSQHQKNLWNEIRLEVPF